MKSLVISLLFVIGLSGCGTGSSEYGGYTPSFPSYSFTSSTPGLLHARGLPSLSAPFRPQAC
jgi:hypothetical protein